MFGQFNRLQTIVVADPVSFDTKIVSLRKSITAATSLVSGITAVGSVADFEKYAAAVPALVRNLVNIFNSIDISKATAFKTAASEFTNTVRLFTPKTLTDIATYNSRLKGSAENVAGLITKYNELRTSLAALTGTNGSLASLTTFFSNLVADLKAKWDTTVATFNTNLTTAGVTVTVTAPADGTLSRQDKDNLSNIATNTQKYPIIKSLGKDGYQQATFAATGGYIQGQGTATSDSIPARLSNGEYVLRASAVDSLGRPMLDMLNATGSIGAALSAAGRNGDTQVAHINQAEAAALKRMGGSGTRNPQTGLLEFFSADAGAVGSVFAKQETDKLYNLYSDLSSIVSNSNSLFWGAKYTNTAAVEQDTVNVSRNEQELYGVNKNAAEVLDKFTANLSDLVSKTLEARGSNLSSLENISSSEYRKKAFGGKIFGPNSIKATTDDKLSQLGSASPEESPTVGALNFNGLSPKNPYPNRIGQTLSMIANSVAGGSIGESNQKLNKNLLNRYIKKMNEGDRGNFTDFYMLDSISKKPYTYAPFNEVISDRDPQDVGEGGLASGGLVTRDRVQALLEPGEFVLRKQAVDRMGVDAAVRLNSTGDSGGDTDVQVNVINNGTAQTVTSTPEVRRENGKIIVDIILDDLRNNGPIKRQIRSIR